MSKVRRYMFWWCDARPAVRDELSKDIVSVRDNFVCASDYDKLALVLRRLLDEVESLDDYTLTRDQEAYKAQACWDAAIFDAHEILGDR